MGEQTETSNRRKYSFRGHLRRIAEDWIVYAPIVGAVFIAAESISPFALKSDIDALRATQAANKITWESYLDDEKRLWKQSDERLNLINLQGLKTQLLILQSEKRGLEAQSITVPLSIQLEIKEIEDQIKSITLASQDG